MIGRGTTTVAVSQSRSFNPALVKTGSVAYQIHDLAAPDCGYLCNAVPSASYRHLGDGWTRVSVPLRDEVELLRHLNDNRSTFMKLL